MKLLKLILVGALLVPALSAAAHAADKLTEEMIREHYEQSVKMVNKNDFDLTYQYFEEYLLPEARITFNYPVIGSKGEVSEYVPYEFTKERLLLAFNKLTYYRDYYSKVQLIDYKIRDIEISADGLSATIKDFVTNIVDGYYDTKVKTVVECVDQLVLNPEGLIRLSDVSCTVTDYQTEYYPKPAQEAQ